MTKKEQGLQKIKELVSRFNEQLLQLNKDLQAATLESKKEQIKTKIDYLKTR